MDAEHLIYMQQQKDPFQFNPLSADGEQYALLSDTFRVQRVNMQKYISNVNEIHIIELQLISFIIKML